MTSVKRFTTFVISSMIGCCASPLFGCGSERQGQEDLYTEPSESEDTTTPPTGTVAVPGTVQTGSPLNALPPCPLALKGSCKKAQECKLVDDPTNRPIGTPCLLARCELGEDFELVPTVTPKPKGTKCDTDPTKECDGEGNCE